MEAVEFEIEAASGSVSMNDSAEIELDAGSYILVCKCADSDSFECEANATTLSSGDPLNICISSKDSELIVLKNITSLELVSEDSDVDKFQIIASTPNEAAKKKMSSLNLTNSNGPWSVKTLVPNRFFSYSDQATVSVSGKVEVSLSSSQSGSRSLRAERPGYGVESAPFELKVALERENIVSDKIVKLDFGLETVELEIESAADSLSIDVAASGGAVATLGLAGLMAAVGVNFF